ncbi:hypothetical protein GGI21_001636 [Coemansia aciculifera]|nr:hypothetical protein GGI21_001636 [Coemansia aciculifera]
MGGTQPGSSAIANFVASEATRVICEYCHTAFSQQVARLADVEWEVRDTALEFISSAVNSLEWAKVHGLVVDGCLLQDIVSALSDTKEYVRASAAQVLVALLGSSDVDFVQQIADYEGLGRQQLKRLLDDSEAFVKRAALDLVRALGSLVIGDIVESREWLHCLSYSRLYQMSDAPDFEICVCCAKVLVLLVGWMQYLDIPVDGRAFITELQAEAPVLDMCADSSRYVRRVCLDSLRKLKDNIECGTGWSESDLLAETDDEPEGKRQTTEQDYGEKYRYAFYRKLCGVDFARLESTLTAEHLYQEALDTQVEREMMTETQDQNVGNNILDCY